MERIKAAIDREECRPEIWCYYLYLTTLYAEEDAYVDEITERISWIYKKNRDNWRIGWLMLHLLEEYAKSPSRRWMFLEEQFQGGCTSPVLYIEAWHLLEMNPALLMKMESFEIQVLNFAAKKGFLIRDIIVQVRYQIQKMKAYSERAFYILKEYYGKFPDNETLQAVCTLLIKGNRTDSASFSWYSLGVEQELRITRLYEYYDVFARRFCGGNTQNGADVFCLSESARLQEKRLFIRIYLQTEERTSGILYQILYPD